MQRLLRPFKQNTPCWAWWNSAWRSASFQRWMPGHIDTAIIVDNETSETRAEIATAIVFGDMI